MTQRNMLLSTPPYEVEKEIKKLGNNLRIARLSRNLTIKEVAEKIGAGVRSVSDAEKGKVSASVAVYYALLWTYGLLKQANALADPTTDAVGIALSNRNKPKRAKTTKGIDNDF